MFIMWNASEYSAGKLYFWLSHQKGKGAPVFQFKNLATESYITHAHESYESMAHF